VSRFEIQSDQEEQPGFPGKEVEMTGKMKSTAVTLVLVGVVLGTMMACGAGGAPPPEPAKPAAANMAVDPEISHDVSLKAKATDDVKSDVVVRPWLPVKVVTVKRGERVKFIARNLTAWILIPDGRLEQGSGGTDWKISESYIAFKIDKGNATVIVPDDYPDSDDPTEIRYSILATDGTRWDYMHSESPPMIIIPKFPSG
jgi:hypothetical protein